MGVDAPLHDFRPLFRKKEQVETDKGTIRLEKLHGQSTLSHEVTPANLDESTEFCNTFPRCVQQLTGQRVQNNVHSPITRLLHDGGKEAGISRVEDMMPWNMEVIDQVVDFFLAAHSTVDLSRSR